MHFRFFLSHILFAHLLSHRKKSKSSVLSKKGEGIRPTSHLRALRLNAPSLSTINRQFCFRSCTHREPAIFFIQADIQICNWSYIINHKNSRSDSDVYSRGSRNIPRVKGKWIPTRLMKTATGRCNFPQYSVIIGYDSFSFDWEMLPLPRLHLPILWKLRVVLVMD